MEKLNHSPIIATMHLEFALRYRPRLVFHHQKENERCRFLISLHNLVRITSLNMVFIFG